MHPLLKVLEGGDRRSIGIEELVVIGTPAMKARGRKLLDLLDPHKVSTRARRKLPGATHNPSLSQ